MSVFIYRKDFACEMMVDFMKFMYPAVFRKVSEDHYTGYFPDLEGTEVSGSSMTEVLQEAIEAGAAWIKLELEEGGNLPPISEPSDLDLKEEDIFRQISMIIRLTDGWDE